MMECQREVISSSAASQVIGVNLPSPLAPRRRSGVAMRSGECTSSASRFTLAQAKPAGNGWSGLPSTRTTRSPSTCASNEHMSGQSCPQTTRTVSTPCLQISVADATSGGDGVIGHVACTWPDHCPYRSFARTFLGHDKKTGAGVMRHGWLGAVAGIALCWSASAADLRIGVSSEVTTLDPHFFHLTSNTEIDKLIYSGLVTQDANLKVIPDLAVSWRTLDETHWEFKLREGVKWQDGSPFTADDVVFTYQRARNVPNSPASFLQFLKHVAKATAVDDQTLVIETDQPDPILLNELLNVWIVSRKHGAGATTADYNSGKAAIGTGPYREVEWVPGDHILLERYDGYFGAKPDWQRVIYKPITNDAARVAALLSGDVDLIGNVPGNDVAGLRKNPNFLVSALPSTAL